MVVVLPSLEVVTVRTEFEPLTEMDVDFDFDFERDLDLAPDLADDFVPDLMIVLVLSFDELDLLLYITLPSES